jgi:hypothetical protein
MAAYPVCADQIPERVMHVSLLRPMEIGDHVTYDGRRYVLCGFDPMSVDARRVELEDPDTHEHIWVPIEDVREA